MFFLEELDINVNGIFFTNVNGIFKKKKKKKHVSYKKKCKYLCQYINHYPWLNTTKHSP